MNLNGTQQLAYQYDELARLKTRTLNTTNPFVSEYGYLEGSAANTTTTLVKTVKNGNDTLEYTYDELGNITSVSKNGTMIEQYTYDALSQLTSATYGGNTYTYTYDNGGKLTEIKKNETVIKSYTYGNSNWKDQLTAFNGQTISYDNIGNPLTYRNGMNFTWQNGRQLATITQNGNAVVTYTYDADGLRTSKTVNGTTTEYYWQNGVLYGQKTGSEYIFFLYDENGIAYGFIIQNGTEKSHYYYEFNLQSDIIGIVDSNGTQIVEYTYGAWGDIISITGTHADTIGQKNPLRYRGYYYDAETGFYYLNSRYYDAEIGRFLNVDDIVNLGTGGFASNNLFVYCENNPVMGYDPYGTFDFWGFAKGVGRIVTGVAAVVTSVAVCVAGAPVAMIAVAAVTVTAGVLTTVNGAADIQQSITGNNFVRDKVFNNNQKAYDVYAGATEVASIIGTAVSGNYLNTTCTMKGAVPGTEGIMNLEPGMTLDRYGSQFGRYLTDNGTHYSLLDLPTSNTLQLNSYRVLKSFKVSTGIVANGGGFQYFSWMSVKRLIQFGFLELF